MDQVFELGPAYEGDWGENFHWKFFITSGIPPESELCTAVFCVLRNSEGKFYVTNNKRGWEIPGGHREKGETIREALHREVTEEVGVSLPAEVRFVGYREIIAGEHVIENGQNMEYPFPKTYNFFFSAVTDEPIGVPSGGEVFGAELLTRHELIKRGIHEEFLLDL